MGGCFPVYSLIRKLSEASDAMSVTSEDHEKLSGTLIYEEEETPPRPAANVDLPRIERAVREILAAVGEDPDREGLRETPARVARMYAELFSGLHEDPREHLRKFFTEKYDEVVLVTDISFESVCISRCAIPPSPRKPT